MPKVKLNNVTRKAALAALFNRAKPQGLGMLHYDKAHVMTENEARAVLMNDDYVDYLEGRVIKVDFKNPDERPGIQGRLHSRRMETHILSGVELKEENGYGNGRERF